MTSTPDNITRHEHQWLEACDLLASRFSTCARRNYMAVILAPNNRVAGIGYNGAPPGMTHCVDGGCPRATSTVPHGSAYDTPEGLCVAQHAEAGALLWSDTNLRQHGTLIVNGPPCFDCARLIASSGLARVVCLHDAAYTTWAATRMFLEAAGITVHCLNRPDPHTPPHPAPQPAGSPAGSPTLGNPQHHSAPTHPGRIDIRPAGSPIDRAAAWQQALERHTSPVTYPAAGPHPRHTPTRGHETPAQQRRVIIEPWADR